MSKFSESGKFIVRTRKRKDAAQKSNFVRVSLNMSPQERLEQLYPAAAMDLSLEIISRPLNLCFLTKAKHSSGLEAGLNLKSKAQAGTKCSMLAKSMGHCLVALIIQGLLECFASEELLLCLICLLDCYPILCKKANADRHHRCQIRQQWLQFFRHFHLLPPSLNCHHACKPCNQCSSILGNKPTCAIKRSQL